MRYLVLGTAAAITIATIAPAVRGQGSACTATTFRGAEEICGMSEDSPRPGVTIVQGETLCLEPSEGETEGEMRLVSRSDRALQLTLEFVSGRTVLRITNLVGAPLWYEVYGGSMGPQPLASAETTQISWPEWRDGVSLGDFRTRPPPVPMRFGEKALGEGPPASKARKAWLGISGLFSLHHNDQPELERYFRGNGYSGIEKNQPIAGVGFDFGAKRWRVGLDFGCGLPRTYRRLTDGAEYGISQCFAGLYGGWDVLQYGGFSLFPMVGLAGGDFQVSYDPKRPPILLEQLWAHADSDQVRRNLWLAAGLIGIEQAIHLVESDGENVWLLVGMRIGYAVQFSQSEWLHEDPELPDLRGGPSVDTGGPFARAGIGLAVGR